MLRRKPTRLELKQDADVQDEFEAVRRERDHLQPQAAERKSADSRIGFITQQQQQHQRILLLEASQGRIPS